PRWCPWSRPSPPVRPFRCLPPFPGVRSPSGGMDAGICPALGGGWGTDGPDGATGPDGPVRLPSGLADHGTPACACSPAAPLPAAPLPAAPLPAALDPRSAAQVEFSGARLPMSTAAVT